MVVAADLQRLAAVEQLRQLATQVGVDIYFEDNEKDPVVVATNALQKAKSEFFDVLLIDSAGRLAIDKELMNELKRVKEAVEPFEVFYVADSLTGQDAVRSATTFKSEIGIDGVILTKFDGDSKGGIAISIANQINVPLRFVGIGEKIPDFEPFLPDRIVGRLLGAGDIEGLAEKVSSVIDEKQAKDITRKIKKGAFTFNDFVDQLDNISKLGNMKSIISMIPGLSQIAHLKDMDLDNSKDIKLLRAIINSMTPKERDNPDILTNSRRRRIAKGAGISLIDLNRAIKQFEHASRFAKKFSKKESMSQLLDMINKADKNPASMNVK
jgi:signal recognition particle subunit SRP54